MPTTTTASSASNENQINSGNIFKTTIPFAVYKKPFWMFSQTLKQHFKSNGTSHNATTHNATIHNVTIHNVTIPNAISQNATIQNATSQNATIHIATVYRTSTLYDSLETYTGSSIIASEYMTPTIIRTSETIIDVPATTNTTTNGTTGVTRTHNVAQAPSTKTELPRVFDTTTKATTQNVTYRPIFFVNKKPTLKRQTRNKRPVYNTSKMLAFL